MSGNVKFNQNFFKRSVGNSMLQETIPLSKKVRRVFGIVELIRAKDLTS